MHALRLAARRLRRQPGFAALAVLTLALGLGASTAIFAVVDAVLLSPLGYSESDRLVAIDHAAPGLDLPHMEMSSRLYLHYRDQGRSFSALGLYDDGGASVSGLERPVQVRSATVTPSVLELLGVRPTLGRLFRVDEGAAGASPTFIVSEGFWRRHLGEDPAALERALTVDGVRGAIIGVLPEDFRFPSARTEIWRPMVVDPATAALGSFGRAGIARLAEHSSIETAQTELRQLLGDPRVTFPDDPAAKVLAEADFSVSVRSYRDVVVGDVGPVLGLILATVGFVLLLATVNVANLFVARAEGQQREMAIRGALGAGRGSLTVSSLLDGLCLATAAGGLGLGLGHLALRVLLRCMPGELPRMEQISIDGRTWAAVAGLCVLCGGLLGLIPQLRFRLHELASQLKEGGRSATLGRGRYRMRRGLITAQMAIAILLLVGAGLMARSFGRLSQIDPGFDVDQRLSFRLALPESKAPENADAARFYDQLLQRLSALPGVEEAASTTILPLSGRDFGSGHRSPEAVGGGADELVPTVFGVQSVSPGYFSTLGISLLAGRPFEPADFQNRTGKVVVSQALARTFWPGENAIGKRIFPGRPADGAPWLEVIGVVGDVRMRDLVDEEHPAIYYPWLTPTDMWSVRNQSIVLRFSGDPDVLMQSVRREVWSLDPELALAEVRSLDTLLRQTRSRMAFTALMLAIAAGIALALGAVGTYGVISFLVAQRTGEIGVRLALGARRVDVMRLVLQEGLRLAVAGSVVGLMAAAALTSGLDAFLYDVAPHDPLTFVGVTTLLLVVVVLACLAPARRAAVVDPVSSLRSE
ncbi:MAG: ABC transporter permease [Acidobacteriota bacterium]